MIVVTRLTGPRFAVNPDLLQRVESTPDTILTLIDGTKYIVAESMEEVTALVVGYRARVVAATLDAQSRPADEPTITLVPQPWPAGEQQRPATPVQSSGEHRPVLRALTAVPEVE